MAFTEVDSLQCSFLASQSIVDKSGLSDNKVRFLFHDSKEKGVLVERRR